MARPNCFNKRARAWTRYWVITLGALVTIEAALTPSNWVPAAEWPGIAVEIGTPVVAFLLTILGGFSQAIQW